MIPSLIRLSSFARLVLDSEDVLTVCDSDRWRACKSRSGRLKACTRICSTIRRGPYGRIGVSCTGSGSLIDNAGW